jgi:hypothetical protein
MTELYVLLKLGHIIGACVLLGTEIGIAFFPDGGGGDRGCDGPYRGHRRRCLHRDRRGRPTVDRRNASVIAILFLMIAKPTL